MRHSSVTLATIQVLNSLHLSDWQMRADTEHFHHHRKFYWTAVFRLHFPYWSMHTSLP